MAKGKGKSLLNTTPSKPKKQDKYSEIPTNEYKYSVEEKIIYTGLSSEYYGLKCEIVKRRKRKDVNYYKVRFNNNDNEIEEVTEWLLKTEEEYKLQIEKEENNKSNNEMTEYELELLTQGIESHKNYVQCLVPTLFVNYACDRCNEKVKCVYENKGKYSKLKMI